MQTIEIFMYTLTTLAVLVFIYLAIRSKAEFDYLQEADASGVKSNSSTRLMYVVMLAFVMFYITYQMFHKQAIDLMLVLTIAGIATGGKIGNKYLENK